MKEFSAVLYRKCGSFQGHEDDTDGTHFRIDTRGRAHYVCPDIGLGVTPCVDVLDDTLGEFCATLPPNSPKLFEKTAFCPKSRIGVRLIVEEH